MSNGILALLAVASIGHAVWNAISRTVEDRERFFTLILVISIILYSPVAFALALHHPYRLQAVPFAIASVIFELAYFTFLASAYRRGSFLHVYPLARGSAPLFAAIFGIIAAHEMLRPFGIVGIVLVSCAILLMNQPTLSVVNLRATLVDPGARFALLTGACTAGYTVCDAFGARAMSPVLYKYFVFVALAVCKLAYDHWRVPGPAHWVLFKRYSVRAVLSGFLVFGVYAAVVIALRSTPVAYVSATREMSIAVAAIIGVIWLGERFTVVKALAIALLLFGVLLLRSS